jgi:hypothetical protein
VNPSDDLGQATIVVRREAYPSTIAGSAAPTCSAKRFAISMSGRTDRLDAQYLSGFKDLSGNDAFVARSRAAQNSCSPEGAANDEPSRATAEETALQPLLAEIRRW